MHLFYILFALEILIAVVAYTNVTEYVFMPVKHRTVQYLSDHRQEVYLMVALGVMLFFMRFVTRCHWKILLYMYVLFMRLN